VRKKSNSDRSIFNQPYWRALNFDSLFTRPLRGKGRKRGKNKRLS